MHSADRKKFEVLATRSFSGEASRSECDRLKEFLQRPAFAALFAKLQQRWAAAEPPPAGRFDTPSAVKRLTKQLHSKPASPDLTEKSLAARGGMSGPRNRRAPTR